VALAGGLLVGVAMVVLAALVVSVVVVVTATGVGDAGAAEVVVALRDVQPASAMPASRIAVKSGRP